MKRHLKSPRSWIAIALLLCLIGSLGVSLIQTNGGKVEVTEINYVTGSGYVQNALLFRPKTATAKNPAPAIMLSPGWSNVKELQDTFYVEYARRGFVVLAIDMYGHGNSEIVTPEWLEDPLQNANGLYDGIKYLHTLPFVDKDRVAISGHSYGALFARKAVNYDNANDKKLISAALFICEEPELSCWDESITTEVLGTRDVLYTCVKYDEWYHRLEQEDGTLLPARDFITQYPAQAFLNYYVDDADMEERSAYTIYHKEIDGEDVMREMLTPVVSHPFATCSSDVMKYCADFLNEAFEIENPIPGSNQIWLWKVFFGVIGVAGFFMFVLNCALAILDLPYFTELKAPAFVEPYPALDKKGKQWYWTSMILMAVIGAFACVFMYTWSYSGTRPDIFGQENSWYIGTWTALMGIITIASMALYYFLYGKKNGLDLKARGVSISLRKLWKTVVLTAFTLVASYLIVFITDYFFKTDYRVWQFIAIKKFTPDILSQFVLYLPLWLIYFEALSVSANALNYIQIGKKRWVSCAIQAAFVVIAPVVVIIAQYVTFLITGFTLSELIYPSFDSGAQTNFFGVLVIMPLAVVVSRKIYQQTKNPYIGGSIMAVIACMQTVSMTLTQIGEAAARAW